MNGRYSIKIDLLTVGPTLKTELNSFVKEKQNWTEDVCRVYIIVTELRTVSVGLCESERQIMPLTL